jgi:hypothetical protein
MVACTLDYETWQPIPEGRRIDWERDVFAPTAALLDIFDRQGLPLTIMAEMGEYFWLRRHHPAIAERMEDQWRDAVRRGHDVQLHLHPNWLPELGAREVGGDWWWDTAHETAARYPGDLSSVIKRCRDALETALRPINPEYRVTAFRAGAYEAQPFQRLHDALLANGIMCDTSVYPGHVHEDREYDYSLAYSDHQPYFASRTDPQLRAPTGEEHIVELPAFTPEPGVYWTFDSSFGGRFPELLEAHLASNNRPDRQSTESYRRRKQRRKLAADAYRALQQRLKVLNLLLPRRLVHRLTDFPIERVAQHEYFVLIAHSKMDLQLEAIGASLKRLIDHSGVEVVKLSDMASIARDELLSPAGLVVETSCDSDRAAPRLRNLIPLDRNHVLELKPASNRPDRAAIVQEYPWMHVIQSAVSQGTIDGDIPTGLDCVCADHALEHVWHPDEVLATIYERLRDGGCLVAAMRSDSRNPGRADRSHAWKAAPHDVEARLAEVGFVDLEVTEDDDYRRLGATPYPPSFDRTMYIRAWKRTPGYDDRHRVDELCRWAYSRLSPDRPGLGDAVTLLAAGVGWCLDYAVVLGEALRREGFEVQWVTMLAVGHPRGRGRRQIDTHEVLEVTMEDGARHVVDPMAGVHFPYELRELLRNPALADLPRERDERYRARNYDLYATSLWYERVAKVDLRKSPRDPSRLLPVRYVTHPTRFRDFRCTPRHRPLRRAVRGVVARLRPSPSL